MKIRAGIGPLYMPAALLPDEIRGDEKSFRAETSDDGDSVDVDLYDIMWPWEARRLKMAIPPKAKEIRIRINSQGGDLFAGISIYNLLKEHPARVVAEVDGVAASAATLPLMAADESRVNRGAFLMIHNPHVAVFGAEAATLRETAATLEKMEAEMADIYATRSGLEAKKIRKMMAATTWLTGDEAVESGFADEAAEKIAARAKFDLSVYGDIPEPLRAAVAGGEREAPQTPREFEAFLRDAGGFSREKAKAIAASGFKAANPDSREATGGKPADTAAATLLLAKLATARLQVAAL